MDLSFYSISTPQVARALLGMTLVRRLDGRRAAGRILETEAYRGEEDLACHARSGPTPRNAPMYGPPGRAYVYFVYGLHWCLNIVTEPAGFPAAVLIRALQPLEGFDLIAARRPGVPPARWTDGPAKLCQALAIDGSFNHLDLTDPAGPLWIEAGPSVPDDQVLASPRVGVTYAPEPWRSIPWRFRLKTVV